MFFGQFDHSIDEKGRLTVPARYRELLDGGAYITLGFEDNLMVMRSEEFEKLQQKIKLMSITNTKARQLARLIFGNAAMLEIDNNGRILIPQFLREVSKLNSSVKVVGIGTHFELWNPDFWNKKQEIILDGSIREGLFEDLELSF